MSNTDNEPDPSCSCHEGNNADGCSTASNPGESVETVNLHPLPRQLDQGMYVRAVFKVNDELRTILFEPDAYELAMSGGMPSFIDIDAHHKLAFIPK